MKIFFGINNYFMLIIILEGKKRSTWLENHRVYNIWCLTFKMCLRFDFFFFFFITVTLCEYFISEHVLEQLEVIWAWYEVVADWAFWPASNTDVWSQSWWEISDIKKLQRCLLFFYTTLTVLWKQCSLKTLSFSVHFLIIQVLFEKNCLILFRS